MNKVALLSMSLLLSLGLTGLTYAGDNNENRSESDIKRDISSKPDKILDFLGVKKGDAVLDFLGGAGYYSQLLSTKVGPAGKVVLQNNQAYINFVGKDLNARAAIGGLDSVTRLVSEIDDLKLGVEQFDSAILVLGYHDFFHKDTGWDFPSDKAIPQLLKSLKKGGKFLVIDHSAAKGQGASVTKSLHRIEADFVKKDLLKRGFRLVKESKLLSNPKDSLDIMVFKPEIRRKTDRFVMLFEKV